MALPPCRSWDRIRSAPGHYNQLHDCDKLNLKSPSTGLVKISIRPGQRHRHAQTLRLAQKVHGHAVADTVMKPDVRVELHDGQVEGVIVKSQDNIASPNA